MGANHGDKGIAVRCSASSKVSPQDGVGTWFVLNDDGPASLLGDFLHHHTRSVISDATWWVGNDPFDWLIRPSLGLRKQRQGQAKNDSASAHPRNAVFRVGDGVHGCLLS